MDRNVYALLETEARKMVAGAKGTLPFWLSPTQVRFLPVSDAFTPACIEMAQRLSAVGIRADVDDRDQGVGRKIRDAEKEWIPLSVVYGEKEAASGMLPVRERYDGTQKDLKLTELEDHARHLQGGRPTAPLPLPMRMSLRPIFRG